MNVTISMNNILNIIHAMALSSSNKQWLGERLINEAKAEQQAAAENQSAVAADFVTPRVLRFKRGNPWNVTDEEIEKMRYEYLKEKYK